MHPKWKLFFPALLHITNRGLHPAITSPSFYTLFNLQRLYRNGQSSASQLECPWLFWFLQWSFERPFTIFGEDVSATLVWNCSNLWVWLGRSERPSFPGDTTPPSDLDRCGYLSFFVIYHCGNSTTRFPSAIYLISGPA